MPARKKVEIRPRAVVSFHYVGGLESMGADEWRAGKSGPGALGSLPKGPTGSTSYELLSTDYDDCLRRSLGTMMEMLSSSLCERRIMEKRVEFMLAVILMCYSLQVVVS